MATATQVRQYPAIGEVFELELDADAPENQPLPGLVQAFGYDPEGWKFMGKPLTGKLKGRFKLVQVGYQPNLDAAKKALEAEHGPTPSGQWMKAFLDAFSKPDGKGSVGVADASWVVPFGSVSFPCVYSDGEPYFFWIDRDLSWCWRWLVAVPCE